MDTPILGFVQSYQKRSPLRLHMPGHKGKAFLGMEDQDITEISGADELFHPNGVILKSEENASSLFGAGKTAYSTEGSSLCIRALLYLALLRAGREGLAPRLLAGRNAHHIIEGCFKAFARALRTAVSTDERNPNSVPSTKGVLG